MQLFVGLGNPGEKYARNRHNIGFLALDRIADAHHGQPWRKKFHGLATEAEIGGQRVLLLKPETYMNDSGRSVADAARFLKIPLTKIAVFHDELDLTPGKVKVKIGGGDAGHNGLRSITAHMGADYRRIRLGIGHPGSKDAVVHHVLNDFAKADAEWLDDLLAAIAKAAPNLARGDDARFLTDVARWQQPAAPASKTKAADTAAAPQPAPDKATPKSDPAPTGFGAALKKWLPGGSKS